MQSIYAFREADVTLFLQAQRQGLGGVALAPLQLARNFRSSPAIVEWINATFAALLPPADDFERGAVRYSPAVAAVTGAPGDGVRVHPLIGADERAMAEEVVAVARESMATLADPSIAILVRGRPSLPPILSALREAGIPYRGVELESLLDRPAIRDLVALLRALLHEGDRTAWLAALRAPWCGLPLADLARLTLAGGTWRTLREQLQDGGGLSGESALRARRFAAAMEDAIAARGERSLGGWLKAAWLALGGPATIDDASDLANAELLFAALDRLEREASGRPQLSEIEAAVEGIMASPVGGQDARVQVMTIHRAKGLEFDVVILPDLQRSVRRSERPLLYWTAIATGAGERGVVLASRADSAEAEGGADPLERWMRKLGAEREAFELGRLAYVAATRARRRLHLIGSASVGQRKGEIVLNAPRSASLLGFLWPVLATHFRGAFEARPAELGAGGGERRRLAAPPARRLPADLRLPDPPALPLAPALRIRGEPEGSIRPAFDWAGAIAQAVGVVVHGELQRMTAPAAQPEDAVRREARWRRELAALGIDEAHQEAALARARRAMTAVAGSALAARLLDPASRDASSELALTALIDGAAHGLRIDRTFVDETGTRWVVDWKTGTHEGGDPEAFLDRELERYRGQLERYARAMRALEPGRPLKVGLYFPLLDAWREL
jgi:ATP-dependent exoDNAse (exonuclease V) beta subunit